MPKPASITVEALPAAFGDCLLVTCPVRSGSWRLLVDTGPDETYPSLRARLEKIPRNARGRRFIDLFVVTHIDHDHIGAAGLLLEDRELDLEFGDIWFNAPKHPAIRGVAEGEGLAEILGATKAPLPWNRAFKGGLVQTPAIGGGIELRGRDAPKITLLSPTPDRVSTLFASWAKEMDRLRRKERDQPGPAEAMLRGPLPSLKDLAAQETAHDNSVPNGSSIAFLLEHGGASVLLGADAVPDVMVPALSALAKRRRMNRPLKVDALKLSHHGSKGNTTSELLERVRPKHVLVSTNNAYFKHPDAQALARVIVAGGSPTIWFNYSTPANARWADEALQAKHGFRAVLPKAGSVGVRLEL